MKNIYFLVLTCFAMVLQAQSPSATVLYISTQTGQYTFYEGGYQKSTDKHENGSVTLTPSGPISYSVDPSDLSIGVNQSKSWTGKIFPDLNNAPAPGTSADAKVTGDYTIYYSRPQGSGSDGEVISTYTCKRCDIHEDGGTHEMVRKSGSEVLAFTVHSVNVTAPDSMNICPNTVFNAAAEGYPTGGTYLWTAGSNVTITGGANAEVVNFKTNAAGAGSLTVTYTIEGVRFSKTVQVNSTDPTVTLNAGDTIIGAVGKQFSISPTITPRSGGVTWAVSGGLTLNSGPYNFVAFITPKEPGIQTVNFTATVCGQIISKQVVVKVNECMVTVPDSVVILKGMTTTISAYGNMQGTYAWTAGGNAEIQDVANEQALTVKGTAAGQAWAEVLFTGNNCTDRKRVKIIVLEKPRITFEIAYSPMEYMCKGERRTVTAKVEPQGGTFSWSLSSDPLAFYGPAGNVATVVVEAKKGGSATLTCTYSIDGESVSESVSTMVREYSKVVVTASNAANELPQGTQVTYTAQAFDHNGQVANPQPAFHWKVVYIPMGQRDHVGNWVSYELQGGGETQNYTWGFPQGTYPLVGQAPYKMEAWIEAAEYCTYRSGSVHIKVIKNN